VGRFGWFILAKRFTATEKWSDPWFRGLSPKLKAFWLYALDNCDPAGVWSVDFGLASFCIGEPVTEKDVASAFSGRVLFFGDAKMLVVKFIRYQYGVLSHDCKMHKPVFASLSKNGLNFDNQKGMDTLSIGFETLQVQVTVKDQVKEQEKEVSKNFIRPSIQEISEYCKSRGNRIDPQAWLDHYTANGWKVGRNPMKDWKAAVRTWEKNSFGPAAAVSKSENPNLNGNAWAASQIL
jgi:hypothetical protein